MPAALQAWRGSHIVITTIMFNFIAAALMGYLLVGVLKETGNMAPESRAFGPSARLPGLHELINALGIDWPLEDIEPLLTAKDQLLPLLAGQADAFGQPRLDERERRPVEVRERRPRCAELVCPEAGKSG